MRLRLRRRYGVCRRVSTLPGYEAQPGGKGEGAAEDATAGAAGEGGAPSLARFSDARRAELYWAGASTCGPAGELSLGPAPIQGDIPERRAAVSRAV